MTLANNTSIILYSASVSWIISIGIFVPVAVTLGEG